MAATVAGILLTGTAASRPAANAVSAGTVYSATDTGAITQSDGVSTWSAWATIPGSSSSPQYSTIELGNASDTTLSRASAGVVAVEGTNLVKAGAITSDGITMSTARLLGRTTASSGAVEEISVGNGLSLASTSLTVSASITVQTLGADQTTNNTSTWTDVTGMTGISLAAGTYLGMIDLEHQCTTNYGPVFRITDGTNTYGQAGYIGNYIATVSTHQAFFCQPFALGSTTSVKLQYFTDTVMVIKKYPTRGADSGIVATRAMFWRIV